MAKTFRDLGVDPVLCDALAAKDITHPFPIQELTLPLALGGNDLIGQARTGTGKTLAFGLPLLQRVDPTVKRTQALVIVPTRELCSQVHEDLKIGAARGLTSISIYGGVGYDEQIESLERGVHVVVGTPGRLLDLFQRGVLDLSGVTQLVLDEADEMLDMGFLPDVERLVEGCAGDNRHTMLFSATMPTAIVKLARRYMDGPTFIRADHEERHTAPQVTQYFFQVHRMDKPRLLARILQSRDRGGVYVFVRTKHMADRLVNDLEELRIPAVAIHGDLRQTMREKNLDRFRSGKATVLVCTEVAARGLDVSGVTHVVNYDCPEDEKMYLHRIGRTARAGEAGVAITFAEFNEIDRLNVIRKAVGATDAEVQPIFSTSKELNDYFDLPDERPWDHLTRKGSSSDRGGNRKRSDSDRTSRKGERGDRTGSRSSSTDSRRSAGERDRGRGRGERTRDEAVARDEAGDDKQAATDRDQRRSSGRGRSDSRGRSDGRPKSPRSSEGQGGGHDARRDRDPSRATTPTADAPDTEVRDRKDRDTKVRDDKGRDSEVRDTDRREDTRREDRDTAGRSRTRTRTRERAADTPAPQAEAAPARDSADDDTTSSSTPTQGRRRARRGRAAGSSATRASDDQPTGTSVKASDASDADTSDTRRDRAETRDRDQATDRRSSSRDRGRRRASGSRSGDTRRESTASDRTPRDERESADTTAETNGRSRAERGRNAGRGATGRDGRDSRDGRDRDRGRGAQGRRRGERSQRDSRSEPSTAAPVPVVERGQDARGEGQPRTARRVAVEHLP